MKLHKILMRHCAPKDCIEVTKLYVLADDEKEILYKLDDSNGPYTYGLWKDRNDDAETLFTIYDKEYNAIGTETYLEKMFRLRGEFNDDDASYEDAYYGVTHYGWDAGLDISEADADVLVRLGIAKDWRNASQSIQKEWK